LFGAAKEHTTIAADTKPTKANHSPYIRPIVPPAAPRSTPARLTSIGAAKLPRAALVLLGLIYILTGLFYRDPWKTDDVVGLATMLTALEQGSWRLTQVGNLAYAQNGPLATWVGAICIHLFAPIFAWFRAPTDAVIIASRLPNLLWFGLTTLSVWYGTYLLGRRPEAQPLRLPFGGEPTPQDYGRMIADAALLLLVATAGIVWRVHETSFVPALIACMALAFCALTRMLDRPLSGAIALGLALAGLFLTRGAIAVLPVGLACLVLGLPAAPLAAQRRFLVLALALALVLGLAWYLPAADTYWMAEWRDWNASAFTPWPQAQVLLRMLRDLPWFVWPTWPFALIALWQWRQWWRAPHIAIALTLLVLPGVTLLFLADVFEPDYSLLVIPCAVLAALALPTLRRAAINALDWFAVMCFSLAIVTVWLGWFAQQTGWPKQIAQNIALQTSGFQVRIVWIPLVLAVLGTLGWVALVRWRLTRSPRALWRGTVLYTGGVIGAWVLLSTLWMPSINYARSYRTVSGELAAVLARVQQPGECLRGFGVGRGQRASLLVFDGIHLTQDTACPLVLQQTTRRDVRNGLAAYSDPGVTLLWQGARRADRSELLRLIRLTPQALSPVLPEGAEEGENDAPLDDTPDAPVAPDTP